MNLNNSTLSRILDACFDVNVEYVGNNLTSSDVIGMDYADISARSDTAEDCQKMCQEILSCSAFSWKQDRGCWLKFGIGEKRKENATISGKKFCDDKSNAN